MDSHGQYAILDNKRHATGLGVHYTILIKVILEYCISAFKNKDVKDG